MIIFKRKEFVKKNKDWYEGSETEYQKKSRKGLRNGITGLTTGTGLIIGAAPSSKQIKGESKVRLTKLKNTLDNKLKKLNLDLKDIQYKNYVKSKDRAKYNEFIKNMNNKLDLEKEAIERYGKRANKLILKGRLKRLTAGGAIGLGSGLALGSLANNAMKKKNMEGNKIRRNKSK